MLPSDLTDEAIERLDTQDPLAHCRDRFVLPETAIYLDGNSLGPLPRAAMERARVTVEEQWGQDLIASWNRHAWIDLPFSSGEKIAPLLGAGPGQVVCCDSISVNLFKLLCQCLHMQAQNDKNRKVMLSARDNFPTDLYIGQGLEQLLGSEACKLVTVPEEELEQHLGSDVAVLFLSHVNFRSGRLHDIAALTRAAHEQGVLVVWDLAHSAGVVDIALDAWGADFAVGCGYKFLNGGPGAPAFIYANQKHHHALSQPLKGWMGHQAPFDFVEKYVPASGMASFLTGTPPVLSMAVLDAALDEFSGLSVAELRRKSVALTTLFMELVSQSEELKELVCRSPALAEQRGSQLAYSHPRAWEICQALLEAGVIADFRSPDILRLGFSPLVLRYKDIADSVARLRQVMVEQTYLQPRFAQRARVT